MNQTPEQQVRDNIDRMLAQAGWQVQPLVQANWNAGPGIVIREYPTANGPADYVLFVNHTPVGVIEAKREEEGHHLTVVEDQSALYAAGRLKWAAHNQPLPFIYESTGVLTRFTDTRDPKPRSRPVFSFHRPETFQTWRKEAQSLRRRFLNLPELQPTGLRGCQIRAITRLEQSFKENRPRALVQMATGSGKTFTAITSIYRLLKFAGARRVLFLVDTKNLGEQAEQGFMAYTPNDDKRTFTELYGVQRLRSNYVAPNSQVCISTIQRMYSILRGEDLDESAEETSLYEIQQPARPKEVVYNPALPPEFFDFIVIDECHRSIYNLWRQVLEYFDAFLIGLTATPDQRTFGFFHENVVSEYSHEDAVADGVNVGHEVYTIETEITQQGAKLAAKEFVDKRDRLTRRTRWEQLDEEVAYAAPQLDHDVVNPSQIRKVIRTLRDKLPEIFPGRTEVPKTLIFAKSDSHADDIIQIVREEFGEGNEFCKKVTYRAEEDPKSVLAAFRNAYYPRIAVTVDMIATGTDVKPLECLVFMRDVKSRNYFEQMKGRGTRTLSYDDLKKVTPSVISAKTHFVIIDAVGVIKSIKTDSRPLERKKSIPLKDLMLIVMMGGADEDTFLSLANRLGRLEKQITPEERQRFTELAQGKSINQVIHDLLNAHNPDAIESRARAEFQLSAAAEPDVEQVRAAQESLIREVQRTFSTGELVHYVDNVRRSHEQIIDTVNLDRLQFAGWDRQAQVKAAEIIRDFSVFLAEHKDEITALRIFYDQPYRRRELTYHMIKEVLDLIKQNKPTLAPLHVWRAYEQIEQVNGKSPKNELIALVALIRRVCGFDAVLTSFETTVNNNFKRWVFNKNAGPKQFTDEQMAWLRMIKDHILASVHIERGDLDYAPFDARGGLGKMHQLFGGDMDALLDELNEALAA
ncbi:type I site-specific deoxyribonuclease [Candidatus Vecturithrix granuli]|uniref:Type I site-specific deoxyribonuclease n=1 Tax=Vecturithrix granuli TaxID=1499967 RepID=A0A081C2K5_VECG1|nr:type I site-specific deoxyribonuclease [Candidatus Vecturithrix granuli]